MVDEVDDVEPQPWQLINEQPPVPQGASYLGLEPGTWRDGAKTGELPPGCPLIPLGVYQDTYWFLDTHGALRPLYMKDFSQNSIGSLFQGWTWFLYWAWPRWKVSKDDGLREVVGWRAEKVAEDLRDACACKPPFKPEDKVRGRGAWLLDDGRLVIHAGTRLFFDGKAQSLGELEGKVYMTRPAINMPWPRPLSDLEGPAARLVPILRTWNWQRPQLDPVLFLGWNAAGMVGGALPWRPCISITGDTGRGKSTLWKLMAMLHGNGIIQSTDATKAGVFQNLQGDAIPVALDEFESREDNRRKRDMLDLARSASDNTLVLRGGDNHRSVSFRSANCFAFAAINMPPVYSEESNRMPDLRLDPIAGNVDPPALNREEINRLGRMMLRKIVDNWHRLPETYRQYRDMLEAAGHNNRGQDTYGILLALADLVVDGDAAVLDLPMGPAADDLMAWVDICQTDAIGEQSQVENWRQCLDHVISVQVEAWRNTGIKFSSIGAVLHDYADPKPADDALQFSTARDILRKAGVSMNKPDQQHRKGLLLVPNNHPGVQRLFAGTKWQGEAGAAIWPKALKQAPREMWQAKNGRITGRPQSCTAFDIVDVLMLDETARDD